MWRSPGQGAHGTPLTPSITQLNSTSSIGWLASFPDIPWRSYYSKFCIYLFCHCYVTSYPFPQIITSMYSDSYLHQFRYFSWFAVIFIVDNLISFFGDVIRDNLQCNILLYNITTHLCITRENESVVCQCICHHKLRKDQKVQSVIHYPLY